MPGSLAPFAVLLTLPLLATLLPQLNNFAVFRRRVVVPAHILGISQSVLWLVACLLAFALLPTNLEFTLGSWLPVSVTGAPLLFVSRSNALLVIVAVMLVQLHRSSHLGLRAVDALATVSTALVALANNFPAMLVGLGLVDLTVSMNIGRDRDQAARSHQASLNGLSLLLMTIAVVIYAANQNSVWFPLAQLGSQSTSLLTLALLARFAALITTAAIGNSQLGHAATFLVAARLFDLGLPIPSPVFILVGLVLAASRLLVAWLSDQNDSDAVLKNLSTATCAYAACSLAFGNSTRTVLALLGWLIGIGLLSSGSTNAQAPNADRVARVVSFASRIGGTAILIGFPLTAMFSGTAGLVSTVMTLTGGGILIAAISTLIVGLTTACCLRLVFQTTNVDMTDASSDVRDVTFPDQSVWFRAATSAIMFGLALATGWLGTSLNASQSYLGRMTVTDWFVWVGALAGGSALWWFESNLLVRLDRPALSISARSVRDLIRRISGLDGLGSLVGDSASALGRPLAGVFDFLESDGALIWGVIAILVALVVTRAGGP